MTEAVDFQGAVVWITGASSGIGEQLALQLATRGAKIVLSARNHQALRRVRDDCIAAGADTADVFILPLDVLDFHRAGGSAQAVVERFGQIDMLINNAGVSQRSFCVDTDFEVYRKLLDINVLGQIALTKAVLPAMITRGAGHIAVTSSVAGKVGVPLRTGYCAAKHAVMGFFDALRTEVAADGVKVTTITPGFIRTNVARNALGASGAALGQEDENIEGGMSAEDCAAAIIEGFLAGLPEIAPGTGPEMAFLQLKRDNPEQAFAVLEQMAEDARQDVSPKDTQ